MRLGDRGVSAIVGSVLLLALTVSLAAGSYTYVAAKAGPPDPVSANVYAKTDGSGLVKVVLAWSDSTLSPSWTRLHVSDGQTSATFGVSDPWAGGARFVPCLSEGPHSVRLVAGSQVLGDLDVLCYGPAGAGAEVAEDPDAGGGAAGGGSGGYEVDPCPWAPYSFDAVWLVDCVQQDLEGAA